MSNINIVEAYLKFNKKLIIYVSYFDNCMRTEGHSDILTGLSKYLNLKLINIKDYVTPEKKKIRNYEYDDYYHDDFYNYSKLNDDVENSKVNGVFLVGSFLDCSKVTFSIDYHIHLSLNKQNIIQAYSKHDIFKTWGVDNVTTLINKTIYPYYLSSLKKCAINIFFKMVDDKDVLMSTTQLEDSIWNLIIAFIQKSVSNKN